jgi:hypothetical protein
VPTAPATNWKTLLFLDKLSGKNFQARGKMPGNRQKTLYKTTSCRAQGALLAPCHRAPLIAIFEVSRQETGASKFYSCRKQLAMITWKKKNFVREHLSTLL